MEFVLQDHFATALRFSHLATEEFDSQHKEIDLVQTTIYIFDFRFD